MGETTKQLKVNKDIWFAMRQVSAKYSQPIGRVIEVLLYDTSSMKELDRVFGYSPKKNILKK